MEQTSPGLERMFSGWIGPSARQRTHTSQTFYIRSSTTSRRCLQVVWERINNLAVSCTIVLILLQFWRHHSHIFICWFLAPWYSILFTTNGAVVVSTRAQFGKRAFSDCGPKIWNQIPLHITNIDPTPVLHSPQDLHYTCLPTVIVVHCRPNCCKQRTKLNVGCFDYRGQGQGQGHDYVRVCSTGNEDTSIAADITSSGQTPSHRGGFPDFMDGTTESRPASAALPRCSRWSRSESLLRRVVYDSITDARQTSIVMRTSVGPPRRTSSRSAATHDHSTSGGLIVYTVAQKSKLLHFVHIFTKYWPVFTIFTSRLCKKFATQCYAHHTYCLASLPCKT